MGTKRGYVARLREDGQQPEYRARTDVGHLGIDDRGGDVVVSWVTGRLTTPPALATCGPS